MYRNKRHTSALNTWYLCNLSYLITLSSVKIFLYLQLFQVFQVAFLALYFVLCLTVCNQCVCVCVCVCACVCMCMRLCFFTYIHLEGFVSLEVLMSGNRLCCVEHVVQTDSYFRPKHRTVLASHLILFAHYEQEKPRLRPLFNIIRHRLPSVLHHQLIYLQCQSLTRGLTI